MRLPCKPKSIKFVSLDRKVLRFIENPFFINLIRFHENRTAEKLSQVGKALERLNLQIDTKALKVKSIEEDLKGIERRLSESTLIKRNIDDNLKVRTMETEIQVLQESIKDRHSQLEMFNPTLYREKLAQLTRKQESLVGEVSNKFWTKFEGSVLLFCQD